MAKYKDEIKKIVFFTLLATLFLLVFSDDTSPLAKYWYGSDSSLYMLFGKGLKYGLLPYVDLFDHKGPYFFFLQEIGQILWEGKNGIFILQIINLTVALYYANKIYELVNSELKALTKILLTLPFLWLLAGTLEGGNDNEEFILGFSVYSLYIFLRYLNNADNDYEFKPIYAGVYGLFFGFIAFSRINNSGYICAIVLTIVIILIKNKEFENLLHNALFFIGGFLIAVIPMIMFYYFKGALSQMLYSAFVFAFQYSTNISLATRIKDYIFSITFLFFIPALIPSIFYICCKKTKTYDFLFSAISMIFTFIITFVGYGYLHYFVLVAPSIVFCIYSFIKYSDYSLIYFKNKIILSFAVLLVLCQAYRVAIAFGNSLVHVVDVNITYRQFGYYKELTEKSAEIVDYIPEDERDSIWSYGVGSNFYLRADVFPCIKYYDFVEMYFKENLGEVKTEIMQLLNEKKPKWVFLENNDSWIPEEIGDFVEKGYEPYYENRFYCLFKRR